MKVRLQVGPNRGYQPLGSRIYADKADAPDLNESFKYQHELPADDRDIVDGNRVHARNPVELALRSLSALRLPF